MAFQRAVYRPRDAAHTVLHQVVAEHLEAFLGAVAEAGDGSSLPQFVEREFREFLTCGVFEGGVARFPLTMRVPDAQDSTGEESVPSAGPLEGPHKGR